MQPPQHLWQLLLMIAARSTFRLGNVGWILAPRSTKAAKSARNMLGFLPDWWMWA
jgi:hypothetical protein